jgi:hypothetical protein
MPIALSLCRARWRIEEDGLIGIEIFAHWVHHAFGTLPLDPATERRNLSGFYAFIIIAGIW